MQVFPEGAQDPLQRREEAGNEAKVPTLRGEDGYVSSEGACPVAGLDRANTLFFLPLPRPEEQFVINRLASPRDIARQSGKGVPGGSL